MDAVSRQRALCLLCSARPNAFALCRTVEASCRAVAATECEYREHVLRAAHNMRANHKVGTEVVRVSNAHLARNTDVERLERARHVQSTRFRDMLRDKYDELDDEQFLAIVKCRRCGGTDIAWEEKQTRSADESATVFCECLTCKNRWVMR